MTRVSYSRIGEWSVQALLILSILWKGGKGLEMTWLTALVAALLTLMYGVKRLLRLSDTHSSADTGFRNAEEPLALWSMVLGFMILTILSYFHSSTRNYGLDVVLQTVSFSLIFLWTVRKTLQGKHNNVLLNVIQNITWATVIASLIGIVVYISQPVNRFVGTFFDYRFNTDFWPNAWAEFVLLAWPIMIIQWSQTESVRLRRLLLASIGLVLGSLLLSYSRGAALVFILQCAVMIALFGFLRLRDHRYKRVIGKMSKSAFVRSSIIGVIAVLVFLLVNVARSQFHDVQSVGAKITFTASEGTSSIDERNQFWHQAWTLSHQHPWLGFGPYSFRFIQPKLASGVLATSDHAHNVILNTAVERGWPASILELLIILYVLFTALRSLFTVHHEWSPEKNLLTIMLITAVVGVYAHNMIDYNLQFVGISLPFWLCLGFLFVPPMYSKESVLASFTRWKFSQIIFKLKLFLACTLIVVGAVEGFELFLSSLGRHAEIAHDTTQALQWYTSANHQWFSRDMHLSEAQLFLEKSDTSEALKQIDAYKKENAFDPRVWKVQGQIYLRMQDYKSAETSLNKAYDLGKYTDLGILNLLLETGRDPNVRNDLLGRKLAFDKLFSDYADAIEHNVHFIDLSTNVEALQAVSRQLSKLFPTDEDRYKQITRRAVLHAEGERSHYTARALGSL